MSYDFFFVPILFQNGNLCQTGLDGTAWRHRFGEADKAAAALIFTNTFSILKRLMKCIVNKPHIRRDAEYKLMKTFGDTVRNFGEKLRDS